jgi:hypothetical protein
MTEKQMRLQVRIVQVVYRAELAKLRRSEASIDSRREAVSDLRSRCFAVLQGARSHLDGGAIWHADLLAAISDVESELARSPDLRQAGIQH